MTTRIPHRNPLSNYEFDAVIHDRAVIQTLHMPEIDQFIESITSIQKFLYSAFSCEAAAVPLENVKNMKGKLENKFSNAIGQLLFAKVEYEGLVNDIKTSEGGLSEGSLAEQRQRLEESGTELDLAIDNLDQQRRDILEINATIRSLQDTNCSFSYTEEELLDIFGNELTKEIIRDSDTTVTYKTIPTTNGQQQQSTETAPQQPKEIKLYQFKANVSTSTSTLEDIQHKLNKSIESYEQDLTQLKERFADYMGKLEKVKEILGIQKEEEEEDKEGDVKMEDYEEEEDDEVSEEEDSEGSEDEDGSENDSEEEEEEEEENDDDNDQHSGSENVSEDVDEEEDDDKDKGDITVASSAEPVSDANGSEEVNEVEVEDEDEDANVENTEGDVDGGEDVDVNVDVDVDVDVGDD